MEDTVKKQRERIIDSAYTLALREGISALSVRKAAKEASIGASTLRYYFPSQDDLRVAVVDRYLEKNLSDIHILDSSRSASDRLVECLQQFLPTSSMEESSSLPWPRTDGTTAPDADPELTNQILGMATDHTHRRIAHWLNILKKEAALAPDQPTTPTVGLLCALVNGLSIDLNSRFPSISHTEAMEIIRNVVDKLVLI
ncbi:TetR/AcrR family transcriptional regulator [Corynebacterium sp. sy017]|uniref:TetR/AcrR family transcriptional regulator n=1 Tax=unclassified Corynebacterium TaxID=2624378 RepID=UPI001184AA30|nr:MULTISPECIES: TetR/AcrR family transcriptional regulator [unclassified Corynebacterium]MBP3088469.1 TetR/AcrR family transcriptional regulator [Corynebacterium sp. sy017]TSD91777.1 TetR/AcrR family transcriptional regulator [Corynebacterium sp. SY003]